ncbi:MAG: hypothetical protein OXG11_06345 [Chloroflexi bacterium]|nr:hypothetical protein [Chloroflexota bacterium]
MPWEEAGLAQAERAFHEAHERRFTYSTPESAVEVVAVRVAATVASPKPAQAARQGNPHNPTAEAEAPVFFGGEFVQTPIFSRDDLQASAQVQGPAIVSQTDCTIVIPPGWRGRIDPYMALILTRAETG